MSKAIKIFQKFIVLALLGIMSIVIIVSTYELLVIFYNEISDPIKESGMMLDTQEITRIFGFFFNVIIGFELFETIEHYLDDGKFHGEIILMVGLIAVARKVIVLDFTKEDPLLIIALGILIGFLSLGYFFIKKQQKS